MEETKVFNIWKWLVIMLVGCNIALIAMVWFRPQRCAPPPPPTPGHRPPGGFKEQLGFTAEQDEAFNKMTIENRHKIDSLKMLARDAREHFFAGLKSDKQPAELDSLAGVLGSYHKSIELQTYTHFSQLRATLTDKQKVVFDSVVQDVLKSLPEQPRLTRKHGPEQGPPPDDRGGPPPHGDRPPPPDGEGPPPPPPDAR